MLERIGTYQKPRTDSLDEHGPGRGPRSGDRVPGVDVVGRRGRYKRVLDCCVVGTAVVLLLPLWVVLGAAIALAIRLEDGGPVLYRQPRLGRGGKVFRILKFRTMVEEAEAHTGPMWAGRRDTRTTAVGRVLRRFHLDELPQMVNVLRGEMSLVGPRPERPELAASIAREVPGFERRLQVRPGIMGLAQARGGYHAPPRHKLRYDMVYIGAMSPWLDLKLCAVCMARVLFPLRVEEAPAKGGTDALPPGGSSESSGRPPVAPAGGKSAPGPHHR